MERRFRISAACSFLFLILLCVPGCFTYLGYQGGNRLDVRNSGIQSFSPSKAPRYLLRGDSVQYVLKDSTRVVGLYRGTGLWRNGDSLRFSDRSTVVPTIWHREGQSISQEEFYGMRIETPTCICVIDTSFISRIDRNHIPVWWRMVFTPLGFVVDMMAITGIIILTDGWSYPLSFRK